MKSVPKLNTLAAAALLVAAQPAVQAQFNYTTNASQSITITAYTGSGGAVIIPSAINGLPVTSIEPNGAYAFAGITDIAIPGSVTNIGGNAFADCYSLTAITVDATNMFYSSLDGVLFNQTQTTLIESPSLQQGSYAIPASVTSIGAGAFNECGFLTSVTIPGSVTNIGDGAFGGCASLASVSIPNSVTNIGNSIFQGCASLTTVTIPDSVTNIGSGAFGGCSSLNSVTIPSSVTYIGPSAFAGCNLTSVYFLGNAPILGEEQYPTTFVGNPNATLYFSPGTSGWTTVLDGLPVVISNAPNPAGTLQVFIYPFGAGVAGAQWQVDGGVLQPSGATVLGLAVTNHTLSFTTTNGFVTPSNQTVAVYANSNTAASATYSPLAAQPFIFVTNNGTITIITYTGPGGFVTIPGTINNLPVTSIGASAFEHLTNLTGVAIPNGVTNIGQDAFLQSGLTNVIIPASVASVGVYAFAQCLYLASVTIPGSVTQFGEYAFVQDPELASVFFGGASLGGYATEFQGDSATVYCLPGTKYTNSFSISSGLAVGLWNPVIQTGDGNFGVRGNQFGFDITGPPNIPIEVDACDSLANPVWTPLQTLNLINGLFYFSEPIQTIGGGRYYRIISP